MNDLRHKSAICAVMAWTVGTAQQLVRAEDIPCGEGMKTLATTLHTDSLCSTMLICIPEQVPPHFHRYRTEHVTVVDGEGSMLLGTDTLRIAPGDVIVIPRGTVHAAWSTGDRPLRVVSVHAPPFDGIDRVPVDR